MTKMSVTQSGANSSSGPNDGWSGLAATIKPPTATAVASAHLVSFDGSFDLSRVSSLPPDRAPKSKTCELDLADRVKRLAELQEVLFAQDRFSIMVVFQALDAAGKDGTIDKVFTGVNPAGIQVFSFKAPSSTELDHDFLWRVQQNAPERGRIGVFNRSHYEDVLVARANPEILRGQRVPEMPEGPELWAQRLDSIRNWERHLAHNGTVVIKFFLHVSLEEQTERFLARLQEPDKLWKFNHLDVAEQERRDEYMQAYQAALAATSTPWAPWYVIPADKKDYMRFAVADIVVRTMESLPLEYPEMDAKRIEALGGLEERLTAQLRELRGDKD